MKLLPCLFLFAATLPAATIVNVACGGSTDTGYSGGARWTGPAIAGQSVPFNSMRSSSPLGAPFSYSFTLAPGKYTVTLQFIEPRADQTAGQRILGVAINGASVITGLDLFTAAGALKPYTAAPFPVTVTGTLKIDVSATAGNAILSGIQIDSVDVPVAAAPALNSCQTGFGLGGDPPLAGTFRLAYCFNDGGGPRTILFVRCYVDNAGSGSMLDVADGKTGVSFLSAPVICSPSWATGTLAPEVTIPAGSWLNFTFVSDGTTVQTTWAITEQLGPAAPVATVRECHGSGVGWDCAGLLWATIPMSTGPLDIVGTQIPAPTNGTWVEMH
jgi:hypothetical protein